MYEFPSLTINRRMSLVSGIISLVFGESERAGARTVIHYWALHDSVSVVRYHGRHGIILHLPAFNIYSIVTIDKL